MPEEYKSSTSDDRIAMGFYGTENQFMGNPNPAICANFGSETTSQWRFCTKCGVMQ